MAYNDYGQCMDCGRVYSNPYDKGDAETQFLPKDRQPPETFEPDFGPRPNTSYAGHRKHVSVWEGRGISHGYCSDCSKRGAVFLQNTPSLEKARKMQKLSEEEAPGHWWWRRVDTPKHPRKG